MFNIVKSAWNGVASFFTGGEAAADSTALAVRNVVIPSSDPRVIELLGMPQAAAGVPVTEYSAMQVSAVYACCALIGGAIASLPLKAYSKTKSGREEIDSPLSYLLNVEPSPQWTAAAMWEFVSKSMKLRGDGFVEILRKRNGAVYGFLPRHPDRVQVWESLGRLRYGITPDEGAPYVLDQDDMLHFPNYGFGGRCGISVIQTAAYQATGIAIAADQFSGAFFGNGGMPSFVFEVEGKMTEEQKEAMKTSFAQKVAGTKNAFKPFVTTQGVKLREISVNPEDSQLMEARKFQVVDIARAFGVPAHMIGETEKTSSWGSGIENMGRGFVRYTLQPDINRIEQELNRKLFGNKPQYIEANLDGLMRGDSKAESDYLRQAIGGSQGKGWMTINEARRLKNLPPIDGGDVLYDPSKGGESASAIPATN